MQLKSKKHVKTPVAAVGAFNDPAQMEDVIASGKADVISVARGLLAGLGRNVTIMELMPQLNDGGNQLHGIALNVQIRDLGIQLALATKALEVTENGVIAENSEGGKLYEADTVVFAIGQKPLADKAAALSACAPEFYMIEDVTAARNISNATRTAFYTVRNIGRV